MVEENPTYKVALKELLFYEDEDMKGAVIVYKLLINDDGLVLDDVYIVTFDDTSDEMAWGVSVTPELALENAEREWDRVNKYEGNNSLNPFTYVLQKIKEGKVSLPTVN